MAQPTSPAQPNGDSKITTAAKPDGNGHVDAAALAVAVVAAAVSTVVAPGTYGWFSLALGFTLIILLLSYRHSYKGQLCFAFGACFGLCSIFIVGFIVDWFQLVPCDASDKKCLKGEESRLPDWVTFVSWLVVGTGAALLLPSSNTRRASPADGQEKREPPGGE